MTMRLSTATIAAAAVMPGLFAALRYPGVNAKGTRRDTPPRSHDGFVALMEDRVRSGAARPNS